VLVASNIRPCLLGRCVLWSGGIFHNASEVLTASVIIPCFLGFCAGWIGKSLLSFQRCLLPQSSFPFSWDVALCGLVGVYCRFRPAYCLDHQAVTPTSTSAPQPPSDPPVLNKEMLKTTSTLFRKILSVFKIIGVITVQ
jgi:hypothetical protein